MTSITFGDLGDGLRVRPFRPAAARVSAEEPVERMLVLPPEASAPQRAREFVVETFAAWRLDGSAEAAVLITSELVTNAVRHAGTEVAVSLLRAASGVRIEVADLSGDLDVRVGSARDRQAGGVGLVIVGRLAEEWGVEKRRDGKAVWALLPVDPD